MSRARDMMNPDTELWELPRELRDQLESELDPDEALLWIGRPIPGRMSAKSLPIVLFGIPWTAFACFWVFMASRVGGDAPGGFDFFPLFGVPFILIGIGMLSSPIWMRHSAKKTVYAVTDQRVLLITGGWRTTKIRSIKITQINDLTREQRPDGSGDLIFTHDTHHNNDGDIHRTPIGFMAVPSVKEAERAVRDLIDRVN